MKKILLFAVSGIVVVLVVLYIIGVVSKGPEYAVKEYVDELPVCTESRSRTDALGNIYTCIDNEWVYTGTVNDLKE